MTIRKLISAVVLAAALIMPLAGCYWMGEKTGQAADEIEEGAEEFEEGYEEGKD
jgi:hypothetical protein